MMPLSQKGFFLKKKICKRCDSLESIFSTDVVVGKDIRFHLSRACSISGKGFGGFQRPLQVQDAQRCSELFGIF